MFQILYCTVLHTTPNLRRHLKLTLLMSTALLR